MSHTQSAEERSGRTPALSMVNIDSADPARLARSCAAALGWDVTYRGDSSGMVEGDGIKIGVGKVEGFRPAQWSDEAGAIRFHLDLRLDDFDESIERPCALGAGRRDVQPGARRWRVLLDPDGQPLCPSPRPAATP